MMGLPCRNDTCMSQKGGESDLSFDHVVPTHCYTRPLRAFNGMPLTQAS